MCARWRPYPRSPFAGPIGEVSCLSKSVPGEYSLESRRTISRAITLGKERGSLTAQFFDFFPSPINLIMITVGAWAIMWDARKSYLSSNFKDARISRTLGWVYITVGAGLWVLRRFLE